MLFDPGRIKRGLASLAEAGPALEEGHTYTLVIDQDWLDARGAPLAEEYRKQFRVAAADRTPPDPKKWRVTPPRPAPSDPLVIRFPKPLDYALLQHEIEVTGVAGKVSVDARRNRMAIRSPRSLALRRRIPSSSARPWKTWPAITSTVLSMWTPSIPITRTVATEAVTLPLHIR